MGCEKWEPSYLYNTCTITYRGGCSHNVYPLPNAQTSETVLVSNQTDYEDFVQEAEYKEHEDEDDIPPEGQPDAFVMEGYFTVTPGTPKAYTIDMSIKGAFPDGETSYEGTLDIYEEACELLKALAHISFISNKDIFSP